MRCKNCGGLGHNSRTCKGPIKEKNKSVSSNTNKVASSSSAATNRQKFEVKLHIFTHVCVRWLCICRVINCHKLCLLLCRLLEEGGEGKQLVGEREESEEVMQLVEVEDKLVAEVK